jgi:hypothetical protein
MINSPVGATSNAARMTVNLRDRAAVAWAVRLVDVGAIRASGPEMVLHRGPTVRAFVGRTFDHVQYPFGVLRILLISSVMSLGWHPSLLATIRNSFSRLILPAWMS